MAAGASNQPLGNDTVHAEIHHIRIQIMSNVGAIYPIIQGQSVQMRNAGSRPSVELFLASLPQSYNSVNESSKLYIAGVLCNGIPFVQSAPREEQKAAWEALLAATAEIAGHLQGRLLLGTNGMQLGESGALYVGSPSNSLQGSFIPHQPVKRDAPAPTSTLGSHLYSFSLPEAATREPNFAQQVSSHLGQPPFPASFGGESDMVHSPAIYGGTIPVYPDHLSLN